MILKNKILIPKRSNDYMEVRNLAVKGSDFEIGKDLAEIGMRDTGSNWKNTKTLSMERPDRVI